MNEVEQGEAAPLVALGDRDGEAEVRVQAAPRAVASLDKPVGDEDGASLGALVASEEVPPTTELEVSLRDDLLRRAVAELPEKERGRDLFALRHP